MAGHTDKHAGTHAGGDDPLTPAGIGAEPAFSKNDAFNKSFGTGSSAVCVGDDSRLSDARTPVAHGIDNAGGFHTGALLEANVTFDAAGHDHSGTSKGSLVADAGYPHALLLDGTRAMTGALTNATGPLHLGASGGTPGYATNAGDVYVKQILEVAGGGYFLSTTSPDSDDRQYGYVVHNQSAFAIGCGLGYHYFPLDALEANATMTFTANPTTDSGVVFTINTTTLTGRTSGAGEGEFNFGETLSLTLDAIVNAINTVETGVITCHKVGTTMIVFEVDTTGTAGNAYVTTETTDTDGVYSFGGATFSGGRAAVVGTPNNSPNHYFPGTLEVGGKISTSVATWYYCKYISVYSADPGVSGATFVPPDANSIGGWQLNAAGEVLYADASVCTNWDAASDIELKVGFEVNADNTLGNVADTVDIKAVITYKGEAETVIKTQTVETAVIVGQSPQYKQFLATIVVPYNPGGGNNIDVGDKFGITLNLETDTSEVDDIIINHINWRYKTRVPQIEIP